MTAKMRKQEVLGGSGKDLKGAAEEMDLKNEYKPVKVRGEKANAIFKKWFKDWKRIDIWK